MKWLKIVVEYILTLLQLTLWKTAVPASRRMANSAGEGSENPFFTFTTVRICMTWIPRTQSALNGRIRSIPSLSPDPVTVGSTSVRRAAPG
jgi:hypothetical protein